MEKKYFIFVVFATIAQSSLGSQSSKAVDIQNEMASGLSAIENFYKMDIFEYSKLITCIFETLEKCLTDPRIGDKNQSKECTARIATAQDESTVAAIGALETNWAGVLSVKMDALPEVTSSRKIWTYKAKELCETIYSAISLGYGEQSETIRSKIKTLENMAITGITPLTADIFSPFLKDKTTQASIESIADESNFELLRGIKGIFAGIKALQNGGADALYAMQIARNQAYTGFEAEAEIKFSFFKTALVASFLIKAGSLSETSAIDSYPGSQSVEFKKLINDISMKIDDYLSKIAFGNEYETENNVCKSQDSEDASLREIVAAVHSVFSPMRTELARSDIDNENVTENHSGNHDIAMKKAIMGFEQSNWDFFNFVSNAQCKRLSACTIGRRAVFDNMRLIVKAIFAGIGWTQRSPKSEAEIDAAEKEAISKISDHTEGYVAVMQSSSEYEPQMEPILRFIQRIVVSKIKIATQKAFVGIRIIQSKYSFKDQTERLETGLFAIGIAEKEAARALEDKNEILFNTMRNLYKAHPSDKEAIVSRIREMVFANTLFISEYKKGVGCIFSTIETFLSVNIIGRKNKTWLETQSNRSLVIETAINATFKSFKLANDVRLNTYAMIEPEAPAPITSGRAEIYTGLKIMTRDIYKAIELAIDSNSSQTPDKIEALQEKVICHVGKMVIHMFDALKNSRKNQPKVETKIEHAKTICIRGLLKVHHVIFDAIKALATATALGTRAGNEDAFSVIKTADMESSSAIEVGFVNEYTIMLSLFTAHSGYRIQPERDFCTAVSAYNEDYS